ncbi:MBL fold metallo-hydrolase [Actinomyces sp. 594]|uniref:MBL fold metallo-hydrolase n=1 Tax=Actinomyces sp. 594 TaxID=2057793 RepID=UPI001C561238|nr:MBL fold metallo-hydrolase [Actinomyces sp. 594]MBW3070167.1 MBL fold metallo-hydrolase [Actinomyces sp. 594]
MGVQVRPLLARGVFATYGYFVVDEETGHAFLIDPGAQADLFLRAVRGHDWTVEAIVLTHGHFDHIGAVEELRAAWGIPVLAHAESERYLTDPYLNLSASHGAPLRVRGVEKFQHGDRLTLGEGSNVELEVLHVPGHTDDSCAFYCRRVGAALVGDTVYEGGPGLTVFPTGDADKLRASLDTRLLTLPDGTELLSGHSRPTTVARLRRAVRRPADVPGDRMS